MSTALLTPAVPATPPIWKMALASFTSPRHRTRIVRLATWVPLSLILVVQTLMALRLNNSAFQDEALYIYTGHWLRSSAVNYTNPATYFSGSPQLYPVLASMFDSVGGLRAARLFSTVCMLSSTVSVFLTARVLFAHRRHPDLVAGCSAAVFAFSAPVVFLSNFATFDAPAFTAIAWATTLAVWSAKTNRSVAWSVPIGGLLALAVLLKYSSAIDVPFVLLLTLIVLQYRSRRSRAKALVRGGIAGLTTVAVLGVSVATWAKDNLKGLRFTTTHRALGSGDPAGHMIHEVLVWSGLTLALMVAGGVYLLRRQPVLASVLTLGTVTAIGYQIHMGDLTSLHKHIVLGLLLGAPLAGALLADIGTRLRLGAVVIMVLLWVALIGGLSASMNLYDVWPNTKPLADTLIYPLTDTPWARTVGDVPEPLEYALWDRTKPWQWTATYDGSFVYKGMSGIEAYRTALKDNYFQVAYWDGSSPVSATLIGEMPSLGWNKTDTVIDAGSGHTWTVWQRYDAIPK